MNGTTVFFDLETGGVEDRHPNIQIAAVAVRGWEEVASWERKLVFDVDECDPEALALNGYDAEKWAEAVHEAQAMREFDAFLRRYGDLSLLSKKGRRYTTCRMAGHNVTAFDLPRVRRAMDGAGLKWWGGCWWYPLDTYGRALWHFLERGLEAPVNYQLQTLAAHLLIPPTGAAHEALADVRLCVQVAKAMMEYRG